MRGFPAPPSGGHPGAGARPGCPVPGDDGSIHDFVTQRKREVTLREANTGIWSAAQSDGKVIVEYTTESIDLSDVIGNSNSAIRDSKATTVAGGSRSGIPAWFDRGWGCAGRRLPARGTWMHLQWQFRAEVS